MSGVQRLNVGWCFLRRAERGASKHPVLSKCGRPAGLAPQLCWSHPGLHRRPDDGGRQGFSNVGVYFCTRKHSSAFERLMKPHLVCFAARWTRWRTTWRTLQRRRDTPPASSSTEQVRDGRSQTPLQALHLPDRRKRNAAAGADAPAHTLSDKTHTHTQPPVSYEASQERGKIKDSFCSSCIPVTRPPLFSLHAVSLKIMYLWDGSLSLFWNAVYS